MRIAVLGTHGSGKSTLIEGFVAQRPRYAREDEPYWTLVQNGIPFAAGATLPDLEEQLAASCETILARAGEADVIFERCPLDLVAYLEVVGAGQGLEWEPTGRLLGRMERALAAIDLLAFLPLSTPDEIDVRIELPRLRARVDRRLKTILRDDALELLADGPPVLEVRGSRTARLERLLAATAS